MAEMILRDFVIAFLVVSIVAVASIAVMNDMLMIGDYDVEINETDSIIMSRLSNQLNASLDEGGNFTKDVTDKEGFSATSLIGVDVSFWATIKLLFALMFSFAGGLAVAGQGIGIPPIITVGLEIVGGVVLAFLAVSALLRKDT